eukprot:536916-Rhodomonas_salina.1
MEEKRVHFHAKLMKLKQPDIARRCGVIGVPKGGNKATQVDLFVRAAFPSQPTSEEEEDAD